MKTKINTQADADKTSIVLTERQKKNFWRKIDKNGPVPDQTVPAYKGLGPCWLWTGAKMRKGYGGFTFQRELKKKTIGAHRMAWILENGRLPAESLVCHRCDNPGCVRHDHLFTGSKKDNAFDMIKKSRHSHGLSHAAKLPSGSDHWSARFPWKIKRGEKILNSKLTKKDVIKIRREHSVGGKSLKKIGAEFGVCAQTVLLIVSKRTWSHIK